MEDVRLGGGGSSPEPSPERTRTLDARVIGRRHESRVIERCVGNAMRGRGNLLFVAGEPGIGKTTMARMAARMAAAGRMTVAWGPCREDRGAPALWPWLQVLRMLGIDSERSIRQRMGPAANDLLSMMSGGRPTAGPIDGDAELSASRRFRLFDQIAAVLMEADPPVCLVLDDVHRSDQASLDLLRHVGETVDHGSALLVATFRDTELHDGHPLTSVLASVAARPSSTTLTVGPLTPTECRLYARSLVHEAAADADLIDQIVDRSGGNPFFFEELLRAVSADGASARLPVTIREVILQRAELLESETRSAVVALSALGREFDLEDAAYLADRRGGVIELLEPAVRTRLIEHHDGRLRFSHALVRDALYEAMSVERRRVHHQRLATRPLTEMPSVDELTARAHHSVAACDLGAAVDVVGPALAAARAASAGIGHSEAISWFTLALDAAAGSDRIPIALELGDAQLRSGDHRSARSTFELAFDLACRVDNAKAMALAALAVGRCIVTAGSVDTALVDMLQRAEAGLPEHEVSLRSRILARHGVEIYWRDGDAARRLTADALRLADRSGSSSPVRAEAMHAMMFCLRGPGRLSERIALGTELVDLAATEGLVDDEFRGRAWLELCNTWIL